MNKANIEVISKPPNRLNFIDKETLNIYNLFEQSNSKIFFFQNLLTNLRIDRGKKILKLKHKLKEEKSIS